MSLLEVRELPAGELEEWIAWAEVEGPWWGLRDDIHAARQMAATIAPHAKSPPDAEELLLRWGEESESNVEKLSWNDAAAIMKARAGV